MLIAFKLKLARLRRRPGRPLLWRSRLPRSDMARELVASRVHGSGLGRASAGALRLSRRRRFHPRRQAGRRRRCVTVTHQAAARRS